MARMNLYRGQDQEAQKHRCRWLRNRRVYQSSMPFKREKVWMRSLLWNCLITALSSRHKRMDGQMHIRDWRTLQGWSRCSKRKMRCSSWLSFKGPQRFWGGEKIHMVETLTTEHIQRHLENNLEPRLCRWRPLTRMATPRTNVVTALAPLLTKQWEVESLWATSQVWKRANHWPWRGRTPSTTLLHIHSSMRLIWN